MSHALYLLIAQEDLSAGTDAEKQQPLVPDSPLRRWSKIPKVPMSGLCRKLPRAVGAPGCSLSARAGLSDCEQPTAANPPGVRREDWPRYQLPV
mmetsp:Transcript_47939/g.86108  ORF Transcript_47939/g.86108 Transcript_47939/m.86108 type:complete len:94 (-) Transcript_47939:166-447(-)